MGIWLLHFPFISSNGLLPSPVFAVGCDPHSGSNGWSLFVGRPTGLWAGRSNLQKQMWSRNGVCNQLKFEFLNNAMNYVFYVVSYKCNRSIDIQQIFDFTNFNLTFPGKHLIVVTTQEKLYRKNPYDPLKQFRKRYKCNITLSFLSQGKSLKYY